ncbi:SDR family NAD(P)-dependent oxidoreductase, partial [Enterobacter cloacae complex sp.6722794]|uniref:SDR family NAD(P)-dependent oxidoreductase n=1 Tax=Enterobacter cloacae complex sp.6722794 TaxID=3397173 RepID=UPI003AF648DD
VRQGANVVIADLNIDAARQAADEIAAAGGQALGVGVDVSDEAQVDAAVRASAEHFGGIDILVSNAGIQIVHPVQDFSYADWRKMISIHLDGAFLTTRACMKYM